MNIERSNNEVIFKVPASIGLDELQSFADYFKYRELSAKSKASQNDVDALAKKVKKGRWQRTKKQLGL